MQQQNGQDSLAEDGEILMEDIKTLLDDDDLRVRSKAYRYYFFLSIS